MQSANGSRKVKYLLNIIKWVVETNLTADSTDDADLRGSGPRHFWSKPEWNLLAILVRLCYVKLLFFNSLRSILAVRKNWGQRWKEQARAPAVHKIFRVHRQECLCTQNPRQSGMRWDTQVGEGGLPRSAAEQILRLASRDKRASCLRCARLRMAGRGGMGNRQSATRWVLNPRQSPPQPTQNRRGLGTPAGTAWDAVGYLGRG